MNASLEAAFAMFIALRFAAAAFAKTVPVVPHTTANAAAFAAVSAAVLITAALPSLIFARVALATAASAFATVVYAADLAALRAVCCAIAAATHVCIVTITVEQLAAA
jgi:hypothetical protein